jgi:hypothetical protein
MRISKSRITHSTAGEIPLIFGARLQFASDRLKITNVSLPGPSIGKDGCHQWKAEKWDGWLAIEGAGEIFTQQGRVVATPVGIFPAYPDERSL